MILLLLVMFLCCLSSSALYGFGFVPGTGRYIKKKYDMDKFSFDDLEGSCKMFDDSGVQMENYFTFGGMKQFRDLFSESEREKMENFYDLCTQIDDGKLIEFDDFKSEVNGYDTLGCDDLKEGLSKYQTKAIIYDEKIISHVDAFEKIYPKLISECEESEEV